MQTTPDLMFYLGLCAACFFVADEILGTNGILAVVALGMAVAIFGLGSGSAVFGNEASQRQVAAHEHLEVIW